MSCPAGQTRSRQTGRCRKPCARHQAINPATGRCVSKNYLNKIKRLPQGKSDNVYSIAPYGTGCKKDYRDGLVPDPACFPRKRNIYTGYCKTPCGTGRAINPATGNCVTLRYLRMLNPNDYDTDDDDPMVAPILFTPTSITTSGQYDNEVSKLSGFETNLLTENDVTVMRGVYQVAKGIVSGVYSPDKRKSNCKEADFNKDKADTFTPCGLTDVRVAADMASLMFNDLVQKNTDLSTNTFVFATAVGAKTIPTDILNSARIAAQSVPVRLLVPNFYGVWRLLIPKVAAEGIAKLTSSIGLVVQMFAGFENSTLHIDSAKFANEIHETVKPWDNLHLSFAPYPQAK